MSQRKRGEIWYADLSPQRGTEPGKIRSVVIIQTDLLNEVHPSTIICPITTNILPGSEILRVHLSKGEGGLEKASDILIDQLRAIDNRRLINKLGSVSPKSLATMEENIAIVLGFHL